MTDPTGKCRDATNRTVTWAYGVTTVPSRRTDLLPRTLASLARAGFDAPTLFIDGYDPKGPLYDDLDLPKIFRYPAVRAYGNFYLALTELFIRYPLSDRFAIFQDDLVTYPGLREYLDAIPYRPATYLNLYTTPKNAKLAPRDGTARKKVGFYESNQFGRGALGLVFDREAAVAFRTATHGALKPIDPVRGYKSIDGAVVESLKLAGFKELVHYPSLLFHTGVNSSSAIGNAEHVVATSFRGEGFDARELLSEAKSSILRETGR